MLTPCKEALYGGAAGGGKSEALLMGAAQYVDCTDYAALILRRTFADLSLPGALIDRSKDWWDGDADWNGQEHKWTFPSGAVVQFGYCEHPGAERRYKSSEFQFIGFDELTEFPETPYRFLFSRLRRRAGSDIPLRMRAGSNPGGPGHDWVKNRFLANLTPGRLFVPARLDDNPYLDHAAYIASLAELDPITRAQLLAGDWEAHAGGRFKAAWFRRYTKRLDTYCLGDKRINERFIHERFLTVDPAATAEGIPDSDDPDYTVISAWGITPDGELLWLGVLRLRVEIPDIAPRVAEMYERHGAGKVYVEGFGIGKGPVQTIKRHALSSGRHMNVIAYTPGGKNKLANASEALNLAEAGRLWLPSNDPSFEEAEAELLRFTGDAKKDAHDDVVDTVSRAAIVAGRREDTHGGRFTPTTLKTL